MLVNILITVYVVWLAWAVFNVVLIAATTRRASRHGIDVYVTGLFRPRIYISPDVIEKLTPAEVDAVMAHEFGHIVHGHLLKNLVMAIFMPMYRGAMIAVRQELEADRYAMSQGKGAALASALRKLSRHEFDLLRAAMIERAIGENVNEQIEKSFGREAHNPSARAEHSSDVSSERGE